MMTPTDVQYLVAMLAWSSSMEVTELVISESVLDEASDSERELDVFIRYGAAGTTASVIGGIEVKAHARPLDVTHIEQLAEKLNDMPSLTRRSVVSASGFSLAAVRKAAAHEIELLELRTWDNPLEGFEHAGFPIDMRFDWNGRVLHPSFRLLRRLGEAKPWVGCALVEEPGGNLVGLTVCRDHRTVQLINILASERRQCRPARRRLA